MRKIGEIQGHRNAQRFTEYLLTIGIETTIDADADDACVIWVREEHRIDEARESLAHFSENPDDSRYQGHTARANELRRAKHLKNEQARRNHHDARDVFTPGLSSTARSTPATFALIVISIAVALWTGLGSNQEATDSLGFVSHRHMLEDENWDHTDPYSAMTDIRSGQVWRLITPTFVHLGPLHLIFNLMWIHHLGGQIERRKGIGKYLSMVIALSIFSGLTQVYVAQYPFFGGMSGVVYGMFGYVWMKMRYDPLDGLMISQNNVILMVVWFFLCFAPGFNVANGGHAGGLALGLAMGYISANFR